VTPVVTAAVVTPVSSAHTPTSTTTHPLDQGEFIRNLVALVKENPGACSFTLAKKLDPHHRLTADRCRPTLGERQKPYEVGAPAKRLAPAVRQERNRRNPALAGSERGSTQALGIGFTAVGCDVAATSELVVLTHPPAESMPRRLTQHQCSVSVACGTTLSRTQPLASGRAVMPFRLLSLFQGYGTRFRTTHAFRGAGCFHRVQRDDLQLHRRHRPLGTATGSPITFVVVFWSSLIA